jgi:hypothetical protein
LLLLAALICSELARLRRLLVLARGDRPARRRAEALTASATASTTAASPAIPEVVPESRCALEFARRTAFPRLIVSRCRVARRVIARPVIRGLWRRPLFE